MLCVQGPQYNQIYTKESEPVLAYLWASALGKTWSDIALIVVSPPTNGTLHQVAQDGSIGEPISLAFDPTRHEVINQWVSAVANFSSYRTIFGLPNAYHPANLIGPPPETQIYGDAPGNSWCPATTCNVASTSPEYVTVREKKKKSFVFVDFSLSNHRGPTLFS